MQLRHYIPVIYNPWRQKKKKKKIKSAYSEEQQVVDLKSQKVKLNDGHFIPVLVYGTCAPPEVTVVIWNWDINSSGCNMSEKGLDCQALSPRMTLGGSLGSTKQARTIPYERGESIQSSVCIRVWGCAHLQITLGSPPVSISFPAWQKSETQLSRSLTVSRLALRVIAMAVFSVYIISELFPPSETHDSVK